MLEGANFILLKGLWDAHGVSCRAAEPIGRSLHSLQDAALCELHGARFTRWSKVFLGDLLFFNYLFCCCFIFLSYVYPIFILSNGNGMVTIW